MRSLGLPIKDVRSQGKGSLSSANILRTGRVLQMQTSALFVAKNFEFFEIYGVSTRTRGGVESIFMRFCVDAFHGRPLI